MKPLFLAALLGLTAILSAQDAVKPKVATFPLGGTSDADLRDQIGYAIRAKLDRDGTYDPIDGPAMSDLAATADTPLTRDTPPQTIQQLAAGSGAAILIWGDISPVNGKDLLRLKTLDLRQETPTPTSFQLPLPDNGQIRDPVEKYLATLPGIKPFEHPNEDPVHHDPLSDAAFAANPNLVGDGDFLQPGHWQAIYQLEKYPVSISPVIPPKNKVAIVQTPGQPNALAMNLSAGAAHLNGLAALSDPIPILPGVRYRLSFRYRSDGPTAQVFVKGYTPDHDLAGAPEDREVYRLQAPPGGGTDGQWQTIVADLNPSNLNYPVRRLRVDLYAYLTPGTIMFEDIVLKAVGRQEGAATEPAVP